MILLPTEIDLSKLNYITPTSEKGYYRSAVKYDNGEDELLIQTPPLVITCIDESSIELEISKNKKHENIYKVLRSLEDISIDNIKEQSLEWFGKNIPLEKIKLMYKSYFFNPDTLNGNFTVRFKKHKKLQIYDDDKNMVDGVKEGDIVVCILYINGLLFGKNSSKLDIRVIQMKVIPEPPKLNGCHVDSESDVEEQEDEVDYDSDMDDNFNFEPVTTESLDDPTLSNPPDTTEDTSDTDIIENNKVVANVDVENTGVGVEKSEFDKRLTELRAELKKCTVEGDVERIEEIACEIIELKKSK